MAVRAPQSTWRFQPLDSRRFADLERLFGTRGACGGCWCMFERLPRAEFLRGKGDGNRRALEGLVRAGGTPLGVLAYASDEPVGWCAVAPREATPRLERSCVRARVDDRPVWSITCLFVRRDQRGQGLSVALLRAACRQAARLGAQFVEGYPTDTTARRADAFVWTGLLSAFVAAGFREVARRSPTRPIVRRRLRFVKSR